MTVRLRANVEPNWARFRLYRPPLSSARLARARAKRRAISLKPLRFLDSASEEQVGSRREQDKSGKSATISRHRRASNDSSFWGESPLYVLDKFTSSLEIRLAARREKTSLPSAVDHSCYCFQNFAELDNCSPVSSATAMQDAICCCS